jgi:hypothetical protein
LPITNLCVSQLLLLLVLFLLLLPSPLALFRLSATGTAARGPHLSDVLPPDSSKYTNVFASILADNLAGILAGSFAEVAA